MSGFFISIPFKNSGRFMGLLRSYGETPWPIVIKFGSNVLGTKAYM